MLTKQKPAAIHKCMWSNCGLFTNRSTVTKCIHLACFGNRLLDKPKIESFMILNVVVILYLYFKSKTYFTKKLFWFLL